ncbi:MAG: helix-turn-helix domain-containing protein [Reichenbachiella sp.]
MEEKTLRQLAAIMFTDIVGYTAMMEDDEKNAIKVRARHRDVFQKQHQFHHGEIIQYYGDGALSIFKSAVEAVNCAIQIQKNLLEGLPKVPIRLGLHMGDIVYNRTEVYGDGVNFASRIENMGLAGAILLSGKLNDELKNHSSISTVSLGFFELKNISEPVEIFAVDNEGIIVPKAEDLTVKQKSANNTIAVLPFVNMSTSQENEYFSDGITEEIINALAKINNLNVTSRTSSFFYKNKNIPITKISKELNVSTILEGSVRLAGDKVRITAQLIQAENDFHFWSETWDRNLEDIFEVQDEISVIIADKYREQFGHIEIQDHLVDKQTKNVQAYEFSLKAKYYRNRWNPEDVKLAISLYEKALELDPNHSESFVGIADCYSFLGTTGFMSFEEAWGKSIQFTDLALALNEQLSEVHYQLSNRAFFIECDFSKSLNEMKLALKINPNNAEAQQFISFLYIVSGDKENSSHHLNLALQLNPLSEETQFFHAYFHYMVGNFKKSNRLLDKCLKTNNKNIPAHYVKSICLLKLGRHDEVITYFDKMPKDVVILGEKTGALTLAYTFKKDDFNKKNCFKQLEDQAKAPDGFTADSFLFLVYAVSGEIDKAFEWISQAISNKSSLLLLRFADPLVDNIKKDPRYLEFQKEIFKSDSSVHKSENKKALLDKKSINDYTSQLIEHIHENKPYLDAGLSLRSLAEQIDIHPNQLSWLLNENLGKNFNDFINHYRIENFKALSKDPKSSNITILGLAYESGFNSKTVFNTYFKKETGLTPRQYMNH